MNRTVQVRPAAASDWKQVFALMTELENVPLPEPAAREVYYANLEKSGVYYFTACERERVVGFASLHVQLLLHHACPVGELQELIVTASCRGSGVGRTLFETVLETAARLGCQQLEVCCNQSRVKSHEFYRRQGMTNRHYKFCVPLNRNAS